MSAIEASVVGGAETAARLRRRGTAIVRRLPALMRKLGIRLQGTVKVYKLSGDPLKNRSGALRRSIAERQDLGEDGITERVGVFAGPTARYARAHEFGFHDTVTVHAHLRMMKTAWGRPVANPRKIEVRSHARRMNIPERSFLRSALKDFGPVFQAELKTFVGDALTAESA